MIRKKGSFFTFIFSLLPGAGQMYQGFMKRGLSLMSIFFANIFLAAFLGIEYLLLGLPIIWFYSFFDALNLHSVPNDEFYAMEDDYILLPDFLKVKTKLLQDKYRTIIAIVLIVIGTSILWNNLFDLFNWIMPEYMYSIVRHFGRTFPQLLVGAAIVAFGIYLIRGKKKELDEIEKIKLLEDKRGLEQ